MKLAFIGGTRFIGLEAVRQSAARDHEVWVMHRGIHSCPLPPEVHEVFVSRQDQDGMQRALLAIQPDAVIDTFAMTALDAQLSINALTGLRTNAIVLSSQDVYAQFGLLNGHPAPPPEANVNEDSPLTVPYPFRGITDHAGGDNYDKKDVEEEFHAAVRRGALNGVTVLRLPATYGSGDYQRRLGSFVEYLASGKREVLCQGGASWRWTMGHVVDVAHAVVLAAESGGSGFFVYNVGEAFTPTMRERADQIAEIIGAKLDWRESTEDLPKAFALFGRARAHFVVDTTRIRERLGFKEKLSNRDALTDLVHWSCATLGAGHLR